jgi:hypothetical protein
LDGRSSQFVRVKTFASRRLLPRLPIPRRFASNHCLIWSNVRTAMREIVGPLLGGVTLRPERNYNQYRKKKPLTYFA